MKCEYCAQEIQNGYHKVYGSLGPIAVQECNPIEIAKHSIRLLKEIKGDYFDLNSESSRSPEINNDRSLAW